MYKSKVRPKVFVSRCLGFDACRWNGMIIPDKHIEKLKKTCGFCKRLS